jgi:translocator protein
VEPQAGTLRQGGTPIANGLGMRTHPPNLALRVVALVAVMANVVVNYAYPSEGLGVTHIRAISERYSNLFSPAPSAFAIWGVIHLAFLVYAVLTLMPSQSRVAVHDRIAPPLIAANVLMSAWVVAFSENRPTLALAMLGGTLIAAILMYRRITAALTVGPQRRSWLFPFSLFLAWISVAVVANVSTAMVAHGASPKSLPLAFLMLAFVVALGLVMAVRFRDVVFPAVIAWGTIALAIRGVSSSPAFAAAAATGAFLNIFATLALLALRLEQVLGLGVPIAEQPRRSEPIFEGLEARA